MKTMGLLQLLIRTGLGCSLRVWLTSLGAESSRNWSASHGHRWEQQLLSLGNSEEAKRERRQQAEERRDFSERKLL